MLSKNKPKSARIENGPVLILGLIFIAVILVSICALSVMLLNKLREIRPTPQRDLPVILIPSAVLPTAMSSNHFSIHLPFILSGSVSVSEQIWKVTKIKSLGYQLGSQRYDLATFTRIDGQNTVKAYCINRGWDIPDIGSEYTLSPGGIFVPLQEPDDHPFQRFLKIT